MKYFYLLLVLFGLQVNAQEPGTQQTTSVKHSLGCLLLSTTDYSALPHMYVSNKMKRQQFPPEILLDTPPVGNQGSQGSCVGWGVAYTFLSTAWKPNTAHWDSSNELSPSFVYNQVKVGGCDSGAYVTQALNLIRSSGSCSMFSMAYDELHCDTQPNQAQRDEAITKRMSVEWFALHANNVLEYKIALFSHMPVIVAFDVTAAFDAMWYNGGIWSSNYGASRGGHCVCIVGYNEQRQMFKAQNQWGMGGDQGFFWITYDMIQNGCIREAYAFSTARMSAVKKIHKKKKPKK